MLNAQRGHLVGWRDLDCLRVCGRSIRLAGPEQQLRAHRQQSRTLVKRRVLQRLLRPLRTVTISAHVQGPSGGLGKERDSLWPPSGAEKVMGHLLRRRVLRGQERRGIGVGTLQILLRLSAVPT